MDRHLCALCGEPGKELVSDLEVEPKVYACAPCWSRIQASPELKREALRRAGAVIWR